MVGVALCWRLEDSDVTSCHQSHVWTDYIGDTMTQLM